MLLVSDKLSGPIDQFGRNFRSYLNENPDSARQFENAWEAANVGVLLSIVQGFFEGLVGLDFDSKGDLYGDIGRSPSVVGFSSAKANADLALRLSSRH